MKKYIPLFLMLVTVSSVLCHANGNTEVFLGVPVYNEKTEYEGSRVNTKTSSLSLGISGVKYLTRSAGIGVYGNVIFPRKVTSDLSGKTMRFDSDDYDTLIGIDALLGPVFCLYQTDNMRLPLALGFHILGMRSEWAEGSSRTFSLGIGANFGAEYAFTRSWYIFGRVQLSYDFYTRSKTTLNGQEDTYSGNAGTFGFNPNIGVGYRF
ncbi:autotransporter domain-containing protein [Treponema sp. OttesenSCG-928-L16]|nr:autotransporter domain-containing protein [Treponema sp. OttesenSCG-928-L16]